MMGFAFWLSLVVLLMTAGLAIDVLVGMRKLGRLEDVPATLEEDAPRVSIIFSALNEAETIEPALQSLLAIDYPDLEIVAIDDRSTDATPQILDRMAQIHQRLRVLHIGELPAGWLGKNHALYQGAGMATGDYLVFTDADVMFEPRAIARAVHYCRRHGVDHLTLFISLIARTHLLRALLVNFAIGFVSRFKPWKVNASPKHFLGLGPFNMVRRETYRACGGHAALPMEVIDDLMLGKLIKTQGYRQHVLSAGASLSVEWYRTTPEMIRGLQKNIFSGFGFQLTYLVAATLVVLLMNVWPWVGLFAAEGAASAINAATLLVGFGLYADFVRQNGWSYRCLVFVPIVNFIAIWMWWRACVLTLLRGGIEWRGTHYPLSELKQSPLGGL